MESHKRTHLVNKLMEEANLMMGVLEKAMEGQQIEASQPAIHGTHHPPSDYSLQDERASWEKISRGLTEIQIELDQIEQSEQHRRERLTPSA